MWHDSSTTIPEECCIREKHWRGSLNDSFPVCVAILAAFSETPLYAKSLVVLWSLMIRADADADASQTSTSDNMLDVRGLPRLCAEKYWKVVEREKLCSCAANRWINFIRVQYR